MCFSSVTWNASLGDGRSSMILGGEDVTAGPLDLRVESEERELGKENSLRVRGQFDTCALVYFLYLF